MVMVGEPALVAVTLVNLSAARPRGKGGLSGGGPSRWPGTVALPYQSVIPVPTTGIRPPSIGRLSYAGACYPSVHRPSRAARGAQTARRPCPQPALVLAHRHPGSVPIGRSPGVGPVGRRPDPAAGRRLGRAVADAVGGQEVPEEPAGDRSRSGRLPDRRSLVPGLRHGQPGRARRPSATSHPSSASPRCCRSTPAASGILAGDHLKAASDLGVPIIGVGLLYRQGYFRQSLNLSGWQQERYPLLDPNALPVTLLHDEDGPVRIEVPLARPDAARAGLAGPGRPGSAAAARLRRGAELRLRARGHRPAVRRR